MSLSKKEPPQNPVDIFIEARLSRAKKKIDDTHYKEYTRTMWEAAKDALLEANQSNPLDIEIAKWLAHNIDEILANKTPKEIEVIRTPGGTRSTPSLKNSKQTAALYRQAVQAKAINDPAPIKTLMKEFDCGEQTIHDWIQQAPKNLWKNFRANNSSEIRKKYLLIRLKYDSKLVRASSQTHKSILSRS
jgi:hypothetical protein